jgi:acyl carrier protein
MNNNVSHTTADHTSATERTIAAIWASDLNSTEVASDSDFFALGGDSLNMLTVLFRVSQALGVEAAPETLYLHPTLRAFQSRYPRSAQRGRRPVGNRQHLTGRPTTREKSKGVGKQNLTG